MFYIYQFFYIWICITDIYNRLNGIGLFGGTTITLDLSGGIRTIVITNLPPNVSRYFTKIRLNYNPINNKIHLRTNSADEDIAYTFGIDNNDKQFANTSEVIAFLNNVIYPKQCTNTFIIFVLILLILLIIFIIIYI
jgi:hypothetical protein